MSTPEAIVTSPLALSKIPVPVVAPLVKLAFTLIVPAYTLMGPAMLVELAIVTVSVWAVAPMSLPIVKPDTALPKVKLVMGHDKALVKLLP